MSIHCNAKEGDIEKTVLMCGDPLRAKYIAENFLESSRLVNTVRNMFAYTGTYKGKGITIFSHGMGMASMGIYSYELYKFYGVENIIRIGSCGAYLDNINMFDTILVDKSYTEGNFSFQWSGKNSHIAEPSKILNQIIENTAKETSVKYIKGTTLCGDCFDGYLEDIQSLINRFPKELNIIGAEMEAFSLFYMANYLKKNAACLLTVVDLIGRSVEASSEDRQLSLNNMIKLALESSLKL